MEEGRGGQRARPLDSLCLPLLAAAATRMKKKI